MKMKMRVFLLALLLMLPVTGHAQDKAALMLTVFGTSTEASVTFDELLPLVQKQFPERIVVIPYTSAVIRNKLNAKISDPAKKILSPAEMLEKLKQEGFTDIAVVSTLLFPGVEHEKLLSSVDQFKAANQTLKISYTPPLLSEPGNMQPVVNTLKKNILTDGTNVVVAHGTHAGHAAEASYLQLANAVATTYPNARVGSIEGLPAMEEVLEWVGANRQEKVRFLVFMFVAGDHAENDIAGEEDSLFSAVKKMGKTPSVAWANTSAGKRMVSLGLDPEYRQILLDYYARNVGNVGNVGK